jgi:hypothetical protein
MIVDIVCWSIPAMANKVLEPNMTAACVIIEVLEVLQSPRGPERVVHVA